MFAEEAKYSKRNIESNWSKYELPPSDEEVLVLLVLLLHILSSFSLSLSTLAFFFSWKKDG